MRYLVLIALVAFVTVYANQQTVKISPGFFTGKDYLDMSDTERRAYATGEINGMLVAPFFGAPEENLNWLKTCTGKMSDEEIAEHSHQIHSRATQADGRQPQRRDV